MSKITIKRGDTAFEFQDRLTKDGAAITLAGASVAFLLKGQDNGILYRRAASIVTPVLDTDPNVKYAPVTQDTAVAGEYFIEWEITFGDGKIITFPQKGYNQLSIQLDLDTL